MISGLHRSANPITWIVGVMLALFGQSAWSTDYYVSAKGSDAANGLAAEMTSNLVASGPFATLAPLSQRVLQHGDRILLACGERFQGPLHLTLQSKLPGVLAISRFGDCPASERPVVHGRVLLEALAGSGLHSIKQEAPVVQVFSGDVAIPRARFPKDGYLILPADSASANDRIPVTPSLSGKDLAGAVAHARTEEWFLEERKINGTSGQFESPLQYPLRPKTGFYLTGKAWMIGEDNVWAYDHATRALHVRNKAAGPVSVVYAGALLQIEGKGAVSIKGVAFDAAGGDAIKLKLDGVVSIDDVLITRAVGNGIAIAGSSFAQIRNSLIEDTGLDGIFFAEVARAVVRRNVFNNSGLYLGPNASLAAINAHRTDSATIEENIVESSAYIGIRFSGDARIRRNYVARSCRAMSDCAGIYTWRRNATDRRPRSEVIGNLVIGVGGDTTVKLGVEDYFSGIYLDEFSNDIFVSDNVIVAVNQGIYLHNAFNNVVRNNVFLAMKKAVIDATDKSKFPNGGYVANTIDQNSERLGDFTAAIVGRTGKPKALVFDDPLPSELRLRSKTVPSADASGGCVTEKALSPFNPKSPSSPLLPTYNCESRSVSQAE